MSFSVDVGWVFAGWAAVRVCVVLDEGLGWLCRPTVVWMEIVSTYRNAEDKRLKYV